MLKGQRQHLAGKDLSLWFAGDMTRLEAFNISGVSAVKTLTLLPAVDTPRFIGPKSFDTAQCL